MIRTDGTPTIACPAAPPVLDTDKLEAEFAAYVEAHPLSETLVSDDTALD